MLDLVENDGWPRQVDRSPFTLGENMAATPGKVVFRNELIEIIQYTPQTDDVYEIPLLVCPPWINRYYIADLAPKKSLIEWAVRHGHTTFAISYRNPDESMRDNSFDDYLRLGPLTAIDVVRAIAGTDVVNTLAICLGGTLNTMALAYLEAVGDHLVNVTTLLNSATDYAGAGLLSDVFTDPGTIEVMCRRMEESGFLEAKDMTRTFTMLRANDLLFRYVVDNWLLGESPPAFDLLAWNDDGTRMPGKAHSYFARKMYIENALAQRRDGSARRAPDHVEHHHRHLHRRRGRRPHRAVAVVVQVHAAVQGPDPVRAHVGRSHRRHREPARAEGAALDQRRAARDPEQWLASATEHKESWWDDWARWIAERAGDRVAPPAMGNDAHPQLGDAPGTYVRS